MKMCLSLSKYFSFQLKAVLLASIIIINIPAELIADTTLCQANEAYRSYCKEVSYGERCSRQFTEVCCRCESVWEEEFAYCRFQPTLFPPPPVTEPTPTPTPGTGEPEPEDEFRPELINCGVHLDFSAGRCVAGEQQVRVDLSAMEALTQGVLDFSLSSSCNSESANATFVQVSGEPLAQPTSESELLFISSEPALLSEYRCDLLVVAELRAADTGELLSRRHCPSALLVNNCDLGCESTYLREVFLRLDNFALSQSKTARQIIAMQKLSGVSKRRIKALRRKAHNFYLQSWTQIWEMRDLVKVCDNATLCVSVQSGGNTALYENNSKQLFRMARRASRIVRASELSARMMRKIKRLMRSAKRERQAARTELSLVPLTTSQCE